MYRNLPFYLFSLILIASPQFALAQPLSAEERAALMDRTMDCFEPKDNGGQIDWQDVCVLNNGISDDEVIKSEEVDKALDQAEHGTDDSVLIEESAKAFKPRIDWMDPLQTQELGPRKTHQFDVSHELYNYRYAESVVGVKTSGVMRGVAWTYAYRPTGNIFNNKVINTYIFDGHFATGKETYRGSRVDKGIPDSSYELRGLLGKEYLLDENVRVMPYTGFGFRRKDDSGGGRRGSGFYGYDRHSNYSYLPLGITATVPNGHWTTEMNGEFDVLLKGVQVSDFSNSPNLGYDNPNIHSHQSKGVGLRGQLKFIYTGTAVDLFVEPFVRYWKIDRSDYKDATVDGTYSLYWNEPQNTTYEIGSKFGVRF